MQEESKRPLWPDRLREQAESGLSIRAWGALNGVTEASYHSWCKRAGWVPCWRRCAHVGHATRHGVGCFALGFRLQRTLQGPNRIKRA